VEEVVVAPYNRTRLFLCTYVPLAVVRICLKLNVINFRRFSMFEECTFSGQKHILEAEISR
jgi:hypothetical protein